MGVTIYDIAEAAQVSITTISKILNGKDQDISRKTHDRVLQVMEELNYKPNAIARSLVTKKTNVIGLLIPDISNPYFAELARGVEDGAGRFGYNVIFCDTDENQEKELVYLRILKQRGTDGIIFVPIAASHDELIKESKAYGRPLVVLDRGCECFDSNIGQVVFDHVMSGYLAAKYLIDRGHRRIACVTGPGTGKSSCDCLSGYRKALAEAGIGFDSALVFEGDCRFDSGVRGGTSLIHNGATAFFVEKVPMACGVYQAAFAEGKRIPEDISVIGYDDANLSCILNPPLTSILQPKLEMGRKAGEILARMILGKHGDLYVEYKPRLEERQSVKRLPNASESVGS